MTGACSHPNAWSRDVGNAAAGNLEYAVMMSVPFSPPTMAELNARAGARAHGRALLIKSWRSSPSGALIESNAAGIPGGIEAGRR